MEASLKPVFEFIEAHGAIAIILQTAILLMIRSFIVQIPSLFSKAGTKTDSLKQAKHGESFWFFVYYSFVFTAGIAYLWDKEWLWDTRKYWLSDVMATPEFPVGLQLIYITQTAFYIGASIVILFLSDARANHKDKLIMLTHHFVTVMLLAVSFASGQHRIGSVVLILHDVSDIFLEGSKLCRYSGFESVTNVGFAIFALVFFVSRLIVFPIRILYAIHKHFPPGVAYSIAQCDFTNGNCNAPYFTVTIPTFWLLLLGTLQCLHIYWFALIFRMVVRAISERHVEKDIRSDDEEETLDEPKESPKKNGKKHKRD
jgi:ceramide synthetase